MGGATLSVSVRQGVDVFAPFPVVRDEVSHAGLFGAIFRGADVASRVGVLTRPVGEVVRFRSSKPTGIIGVVLVSVLRK